ncbi:hypothetical protein BHE74_00040716 [Ensete ventricosum]|nr:hypothetical protein BHE74_00040716 [Ensete ventricosum]RZS18987.1 hypothetical protein BHM03_00051326 [Ensete ventricosum]
MITLKKRSKVVAFGQPAGVVGSTTKASTKKGKGPTEVEVPLHDYSFWELCEVIDHARTDRYFASIMSKLCEGEGEEPLMSWWSSLLRLARVWTKGPMAVEYLRGALLPMLAK